MEQHNLVVSPDGKTWDEVTKDTSYLGNLVLSATNNTTTTWADIVVLDEWRGRPEHAGTAREKFAFNKDWAIAYDRLICLKDGTYELSTTGYFDSSQDIVVNGTSNYSQIGPNSSHSGIKLVRPFNRGDWVQLLGDFAHAGDVRYSNFYITRIS